MGGVTRFNYSLELTDARSEFVIHRKASSRAWMWSWTSWYICLLTVLQCLTIPNVNADLEKNSQRLAPDGNIKIETRFFSGDWGEVHHVLDQAAGYDVILMAETVYSISALPNLYKLIKKCLSYPNGVAYMAAKKYYFGVGGGSRRFLFVVEKDGALASSLVAEVADGSSHVREVWKLHFKSSEVHFEDYFSHFLNGVKITLVIPKAETPRVCGEE